MTTQSKLFVATAIAAFAVAQICYADVAVAQDVPNLSEVEVFDFAAPELTPEAASTEVIIKFKEPTALTPTSPEAFDPTEYGLAGSARVGSGGEFEFQASGQTMISADSPEELQARLEAIAEEIEARPDVEFAHPAHRVQPFGPANDPLFWAQWHYLDNGTDLPRQSAGGISLPSTWDSVTGQDIVVAVLDTGIVEDHEDVIGVGHTVPGYDMISDPSISNDGDGRDADPTDTGDATSVGACGAGWPGRPNSWHGTFVAGTIGFAGSNNGIGVAGVNWRVKILPVRVLGKCGGTSIDIVDAIRWAAGIPVANTKPNLYPARVINMSLGGTGACLPEYQAAINDVVKLGVTVVVAAGNARRDAAGVSPASCQNVITVAASDARGHLASRYSNFGETIEIMAPGGDVMRDDNGDGNRDGVLSLGRDSYALANGTSMAAPHVAGVAALILSLNPSLTPTEVLQILQRHALPRSPEQCVTPIGATPTSVACGSGLLSANVWNDPLLVASDTAPTAMTVHLAGSSTTTAAALSAGDFFSQKLGVPVTVAPGDGGALQVRIDVHALTREIAERLRSDPAVQSVTLSTAGQ